MGAGVVDLAEELVGGVLQHAELLRGAVVVADAGTVEALRWAGALPLLLRDLGVPCVVATSALWRAVGDGPAAVLALLRPMNAPWRDDTESSASDADAGSETSGAFVDHVALLVSGFLWEYEETLRALLATGVVRRLVVCSSLSEHAHECYDFGDGRAPQPMAFDSFAAVLAAHNAFQSRTVDAAKPAKLEAIPTTTRVSSNIEEVIDGDVWDWADEGGDSGDRDARDSADVVAGAPANGEAPQQQLLLEGEITVVQMPLNYAPLLHSKATTSPRTGEPSLFVLSHPVCATAFPLLLTRVVRHHQQELQHARATYHASISPPPPVQPLPAYSHVKEVTADHIPSEFRRTLKLVAHVLGELLVQARLDAKERIYALGNTSLKIGHTLLKILNDLQEDLTTHALQAHQQATVVLVDRTCDLASPCSFGMSLLDRVLALLPQSPHEDGRPAFSHSNRRGLHITEIFPLHGCEPSPVSFNLSVEPDQVEHYLPSPFVGNIKWKGGASLCHPQAQNGNSVFRSLAFRPAKLALRDLDKRMQEVEKELVVQRKISRGGSLRKPGEKPPSTRGRDVVLRRMSNILEAGEPASLEHSTLIELGIIVLETLERMERVQSRWDVCRERASRHIDLRKQGAGEWIIPELADTVQRQFIAAKANATKSPGQSSTSTTFSELLTLLVHAYALSSGSPVEDYTVQLIRNVVTECVVETAVHDPGAVEKLCPELLADLLPIALALRATNSSVTQAADNGKRSDDGEDEWEWDDSSSPRGLPAQASTSDGDEYRRMQAKAVIDTHMERLLSPLKECAQLFAKQHEVEFHASPGSDETSVAAPRCLLSQVCGSLVPSVETPIPRGSVAELEHVVDASEQLARAGIDLLKSGFSRFGFGGSNASPQQPCSSGVMGDSKILVIFVVGGVTFEEVQEVNAALEGSSDYQVIVGGTTITNSDIILEQLFS